ncbi:MAG: hypothetical protein AYK19_05810 [Theionarchaea archaeon DG-70-1]|nr:MAG: hypothetical protein AYK19_05810 [Theionarchaea archaeon DG-70-1]
MDKKKLFLAATGMVIAFLAVTAVTASPRAFLSTPLHTFRMEQASNEMRFLPVAANNFAYNVENGHNLNYDGMEGFCSNAVPLMTANYCTYEPTCCGSTCVNTCWYTCVSTCATCVSTCSSTCVNTCSTCVSTCSSTCVYTCPNTCALTC